MGDRIVDWYFDDNGVHKLEKNSAHLDVVSLINRCAPKTAFWIKRSNLYTAMAYTGYDPRKVKWEQVFYDPKTKAPVKMRPAPKLIYREVPTYDLTSSDEEETKIKVKSLGKRGHRVIESSEEEDYAEEEEEVKSKKSKDDSAEQFLDLECKEGEGSDVETEESEEEKEPEYEEEEDDVDKGCEGIWNGGKLTDYEKYPPYTTNPLPTKYSFLFDYWNEDQVQFFKTQMEKTPMTMSDFMGIFSQGKSIFFNLLLQNVIFKFYSFYNCLYNEPHYY